MQYVNLTTDVAIQLALILNCRKYKCNVCCSSYYELYSMLSTIPFLISTNGEESLLTNNIYFQITLTLILKLSLNLWHLCNRNNLFITLIISWISTILTAAMQEMNWIYRWIFHLNIIHLLLTLMPLYRR